MQIFFIFTFTYQRIQKVNAWKHRIKFPPKNELVVLRFRI